ncbi:MAG: hypothetical protein WCI88_15810 [Chloroflexota bacterium]
MEQTRVDLIERLLRDTKSLSFERLTDVLVYVERLRRNKLDLNHIKPGSAEAMLAYAGSLKFENGYRLFQRKTRSSAFR